ncbi:DksA/TraR family C4-type zinc finger protein [Vibrio maritimus]|uniref:DksA/TraR family C4-type zinc finger protein n=1 Tax=Vibrio maritimus TaxID=990268 RepID=UPI001F432B96|nr:DksA/TraR family C4-type zinc finger protein [Vibrio maritimus]
MAVGWANDDSVSQQIQNTIEDEISRVRSLSMQGVSAEFCDECDEPIPLARRAAIKGVRLCVECQSSHEHESQRLALFNRRGSKDSQLR